MTFPTSKQRQNKEAVEIETGGFQYRHLNTGREVAEIKIVVQRDNLGRVKTLWHQITTGGVTPTTSWWPEETFNRYFRRCN